MIGIIGGLQAVAIDRLRPSRTNPRRHFEPAQMKDLTESIREKGVLVPLLVRPAPALGGADLEIVAGERRYRAAKSAGLVEVPVIIRPLDDKQAAEVQVIENLQRADVHPLEEAAGYRHLIDRHGYTEVALAAKVGKDEAYVRRRLQLERLSEPAKKAFLEGEITVGHALLIARLHGRDQGEALDRARGSRWNSPETTDGLRRWIREHIALDLTRAPFDVANGRLVPKAGPCAACPKRAGTQPALFEDIAKGDTCTDPACFQAKVSAHLVQLRGGLKANKVAVVDIASDYEYDPKIPNPNHWRVAQPDSCKHVVRGIVVRGGDRGRSFDVCVNERCRKHFHDGSADGLNRRHAARASKAERARQAKQRREDELSKAREAAFAVVLQDLAANLLQHVDRNLAHFEGVPGPIALALARDLAEGGAGLTGPGRRSSYASRAETALLPRLGGEWKKSYGRLQPRNPLAARLFLALHVFLAFDLPKMDAKLAAQVSAEVKRQETEKAKAAVDPRSVPCPQCSAKAGSPCKRPSGHNTFGGECHVGRVQAAVQARARKGGRK